MAIKGTKGDDILSGTSGNDVFDLWQGGNDTVSGGDGNDTFKFGAAFTAADKIDGGTGDDTFKVGRALTAGDRSRSSFGIQRNAAVAQRAAVYLGSSLI